MAPRRAPGRVLLGAVLATMIVLLAGIWLGGHPSGLPSLLRGGFFEGHRAEPATDQALGILTTRYYRQLSRSSLVDHGLTGMVASLDDPYSHYIDPQAYRASMQDSGPPAVGIGIDAIAEEGGLRVVTVFDHSPAARAGLMRADLIVKVGSTSLADRPGDFGFEQIKGPAGTRVTLTILRDGTERVVTVVRAKVVVPVATRRALRYHDVRIGYLRLTGFSEDSAEDLRREVQAALDARAQALILDLRGNGGGLINEAIDIASIFIPHGTIMSALERGRPRRVYMARGGAIAAHVPMVVLVDEGTASSAEIVTAALQDLGRAKVVGTHTYGKGVFQITERLNNGGALDITIGEFFTPDGRNLGGGGARQGAGITPNVHAIDDPSMPTDEALAKAESTVAAEVG
jgi:carboxyl-terminal processing protease